MTLNFKVPSMVCDGCVSTVESAIITHEPEAKVDINLATKEVKVDTEASKESISQIITAAGHTVE